MGWLMTPPLGPYDPGLALPTQRVTEPSPLTIPLSVHEWDAFEQLVFPDWRTS
ncbi:hypothetical protein GCM10029964_052630 [Kibdelosporangium lantanae]